MNIYQFMNDNPFQTFLLGIFVLIAFGAVFNFIFRCWNRWFRAKNIRLKGWPPDHLDADGDWKPTVKCGCDD